VNHVELCQNGNESARIVATQGRTVYLSDISTGRIIGSETVRFPASNIIKLGVDTLYNASFSPHDPSGTFISTGGTDKVLSILDARLLGNKTSSVAIKYPNAHQLSITDTKFNNFIPYWVATSGEDGVVKIWDIRFMNGPAARIEGHYGEVNTICWSTTHCDVLASGSTDRSWKAWSLSSSILAANNPKSDCFVGCPGSEWAGRVPESYKEPNTTFGGRLLAEYVTEMSGSICSSMFISLIF
jgi:WD40 repeat protein